MYIYNINIFNVLVGGNMHACVVSISYIDHKIVYKSYSFTFLFSLYDTMVNLVCSQKARSQRCPQSHLLTSLVLLLSNAVA